MIKSGIVIASKRWIADPSLGATVWWDFYAVRRRLPTMSSRRSKRLAQSDHPRHSQVRTLLEPDNSAETLAKRAFAHHRHEGEARIAAEAWAQDLLDIGEGTKETDEAGRITLPEECVVPAEQGLDALIDSVYPALAQTPVADIDATLAQLQDRAILAARNVDVDSINATLLDRFPGQATTFLSTDKVMDQGAAQIQYPSEFHNSLNITSLPLHATVLKVGCPIRSSGT